MAWHVSSALLSSAGMEFLFFLSIILYYFGYGKDKSFFARLWWTDFNVYSRKEYTKSQTRLWKKFYREFPLRKFCFAGEKSKTVTDISIILLFLRRFVCLESKFGSSFNFRRSFYKVFSKLYKNQGNGYPLNSSKIRYLTIYKC